MTPAGPNQDPAPAIDRARLERALAKARAALLAERGPHGHWEGALSSSALSTATAVTALELWQRHAKPEPQSALRTPHSAITSGLHWLAEHQNPDGGWGDTVLSFSNISTTALGWAAFGAVPGAEAKWPQTVRRAEAWLAEHSSTEGQEAQSNAQPKAQFAIRNSQFAIGSLIAAIIARYGKDRTFSVPILTMCALAGRLGEGKKAWRRVIQLPFELAALPHKFFAALRLPVVSYALPALIAIGQVRHHHLPTRNPLTRLLRDRARAKTLRVLERIQPPGGGFLEATPLTSFVTMSLAGGGNADHPVAHRGVEFLLKSMRPDGSWPIDTNLATWVTTLAVNALGPSIHEVMSAEERGRILDWLLGQQYRTVHPYTNAAPGGWAWTDLPGGVPDADDTAGALLALKQLDDRSPRVREAAIAGVKWLLDLQNRDGGIPTFCRGWTNLPFDRSSPDITAHALRAWRAWEKELPPALQSAVCQSRIRAFKYLRRTQSDLLSWSPLWFGNQHSQAKTNLTYGTSKVFAAFSEAQGDEEWNLLEVVPTSFWFSATQEADGGWGGGGGGPASVEESALALSMAPAVLNAWRRAFDGPNDLNIVMLEKGLDWLLRRVEDGTWTQPAPIGFYFAKLWYYERMYPMVFTVAALEAVARLEATEK